MCNSSFSRSVQETHTATYKSKSDYILNRFKVFTLDYIQNLEPYSGLPKTKNLGLEPYRIIQYASNNPINSAGFRHLPMGCCQKLSDIRSDSQKMSDAVGIRQDYVEFIFTHQTFFESSFCHRSSLSSSHTID